MIELFENATIALIGGGPRSRDFLKTLVETDTGEKRTTIAGVADRDDQADGMVYARGNKIPTTTDYRELFQNKDLDLVIDMTRDDGLKRRAREFLPPGVRFIDQHEARTLQDELQIRGKKTEILQRFRASKNATADSEALFEEFYRFVQEVTRRRSRYFFEDRESLAENEQAMAQIINGSTIPTFVIDRTHRVTYWNKAMEGLTGHSAVDIIGTRKQWAPFYDTERPSMADVILDQIDEGDIRKLYAGKWRKSVLIEGAYEAEDFFPSLGESGKWCWFTAAPIRTPAGEIVGAIETIWDKTEDRKIEQEREQHTKELATFCSIYATLSGSLSLEGRIQDAIEEVATIFAVDGIGIFLRKPDGNFHLAYAHGHSEALCTANRIAGNESLIARIARNGAIALFEDLPESDVAEADILGREGIKSLVYIPLIDRKKQAIGIIRAASRADGHFGPDEIRALELIGNRIGVAIENARLQEDIQQKADFQAKLIGSSNNGIVATDEAGKIVIFNPAAETIFGYSGSEVIGSADIGDLYPPEIPERFEELIETGGNRSVLPWTETEVTSKSGEAIPVRYSASVLRRKNRLMGSVAFFQDLREIKRLEQELVSAERLAAVGQTVAGMAHCIKNILHGLKGGSYLVNIGIDKDQTEKLRNGWDMVQRNIAITSGLVQDLLTYSKERQPEYEPCLPNTIAGDVCDLMVEIAGKNDVEIIREFSPSIGDVIMDPRTIHRCLLNLVSNAIDACIYDTGVEKAHAVTVSTVIEGDGVIRFDVSDNGSGMTDEVRGKLFASFFSTKGAKGTGLGLLVTGKLIEENRGTIAVASRMGEGTTFSVRLPFDIAQDKPFDSTKDKPIEQA